MANVSREVVLSGIIWQTADARIRLDDGLSLFEQSRYGSAVILGTIALENIGRAVWLASLADDESRQAKQVTSVKSLADQLRRLDHERSLRLGLLVCSIDQRITISEEELRREHPQDWKKALERNGAATMKLVKKAPADLHGARTTAQYPKLNQADSSWNSSADVLAATARKTLRNAGESLYVLETFTLKKIVGLRELSDQLGVEDSAFQRLNIYVRLGIT